jgi:glucose/arabinose dehydrogenase
VRTIRVALAGAAVALLGAACVPVTPDPPPTTTTSSSTTTTSTSTPSGTPTLVASDYVTGLSKPWDVAFLPDGEPIYNENNSGKIYVGAGLDKHEVGAIDNLDGGVAFANSGEGGLMGLVLDPAFATNHFVYACYSTATDNRVVRLTLDYPASTALSGYFVVLSGIPWNSNFHNGCRLGFQPGSGPPALFVTTGDTGSATGPQDVNSLAGKVLRINPTDGSAYAGNTSGSRWYTRGHRNPQGITFRPGTNDPFSIEHGPGIDDEVNKLVDGGNAGWNPDNGSGGYDQSKPMTNLTLPGAFAATWSSGGQTVAPSGGTFVSGSQWGTWDGALVVACLDGNPSVGQRLLVMTLDASGTTTTNVEVQMANGVRLRTAVQGPDGNLYVVTDNDSGSGKILKVVPT